MRILLCLIILLFFSSGCTNLNKEKESIKNEVGINKNYPLLDYWLNEEVVFPWVEYLEYYEPDTSIFKYRKELVANRHWANQIDTIIYYSTPGSRIKIYGVPGKRVLDNSYVTDVAFELPDGIRIGASRERVIEVLGQEFSNDTLEIGDLEHNAVFKLIFRENKLYSFIYCGYVG